MRRHTALIATAILLAACAFATAADTRIDEIRRRLNDANSWRDHVMVVAHRGGGVAQGHGLFPENSIMAVDASIALGAEMVELDVQATKDGHFVVFHDSWLDRSSTCRGRLAETTLAELRTCRLVIEGTQAVTDERIPTLEEMLAATRDRIFVNIDNKLDADALPRIVAVARAMEMADQLVIKSNLWNADRIAEMRGVVKRAGADTVFMPIVADDAVRETPFLETAAKTFGARAVELINWHLDGDAMTGSGGALFSARARAVAARGNWHLWVNTYAIVNKPDGMLSGGRGDALARTEPGEAYGFWVDRGATIIQTDEPEAAIRWLAANGYRRPYADEAVSNMASSNW